MRANEVTDAELAEDLDAYYLAGGNKTAAAKLRGLPRTTYHDHLVMAEQRLGVQVRPVAQGDIDPGSPSPHQLPAPGHVQRYILTSIQNNTLLHPGWVNLLAYAHWLDELDNADCELIVGTYSYAVDAFGVKSVKRGRYVPPSKLWYAPEVAEYVVDSSLELAPGLVWCGELNILPTAQRPLTGLETYNGRASNIVPHAKIALESVPSMPGEGTKINYSTGTITQRNYVQKRVGILAEQSHAYGGLLVEVLSDGSWFVRQLHLDGNGHVYDIGVRCPVRVAGGEVSEDAAVLAVQWGDVHASEMPQDIYSACWGEGGMIDALRPRWQLMHDVFSMRSQSHHEASSLHALYYKQFHGLNEVSAEVSKTARFLQGAERDYCNTVIVCSNHDRHLSRWLDESDPRKDPVNAKYHAMLQAVRLEQLEDDGEPWEILQYALLRAGAPRCIRYVGQDESFVLCKDAGRGGIECGLHGDRGPGGSRGSTAALARLGRAINKGHDHTATIRNAVYSAGVCAETLSYAHGPTTWSVSHIIVFENGCRQIVTMWPCNGRMMWRAGNGI